MFVPKMLIINNGITVLRNAFFIQYLISEGRPHIIYTKKETTRVSPTNQILIDPRDHKVLRLRESLIEYSNHILNLTIT